MRRLVKGRITRQLFSSITNVPQLGLPIGVRMDYKKNRCVDRGLLAPGSPGNRRLVQFCAIKNGHIAKRTAEILHGRHSERGKFCPAEIQQRERNGAGQIAEGPGKIMFAWRNRVYVALSCCVQRANAKILRGEAVPRRSSGSRETALWQR